MALTTDIRPLATTLLAVGLIGCGADGESVPVPGADAVVTAPVASVERPSTSTSEAPAATDETPTAGPTSTEAAGTEPVSTLEPTPSTTAAPVGTTAAPPATEPPTESPSDDVFLRLGDEGPEVASMQAKLASIDYLTSDFESGVFDEATRLGVRRFQGDYGLGVDGIFGPITLRALNAAVSSINPEN